MMMIIIITIGHPKFDVWSFSGKETYDARMANARKQAAGEPAVIVIDGNQKLTRRTCCHLMSTVQKVPRTNLLYLQDCTETPVYKGIFCSQHVAPPPRQLVRSKSSEAEGMEVRKRACLATDAKQLMQARVAGRPVPLPAGRDLLCAVRSTSLLAYKKQLGMQDVDTDEAGDYVTCRTSKMSRRLNKRSAGWLVACTGSGMVASIMEIYGGESLTQRAAFVAKIREAYPTVRTVVHDDACHLRKFMEKWFPENPELRYPALNFIIDGFHMRGHTDTWCQLNCSPKLPEHAEILANVNSSSCEILFQWFSQHKSSFRHMGRLTAHFFVSEMIDLHNSAQGRKARAQV